MVVIQYVYDAWGNHKIIDINAKLKNAGFGNLKIGRDGIENIIDTISNTPAIRMVEKITKSGAGILVSLIRDIM